MKDWMEALRTCHERVIPFVLVDAYRSLDSSEEGSGARPLDFLVHSARVLEARHIAPEKIVISLIAAAFELLDGNSAAVDELVSPMIPLLSPDGLQEVYAHLDRYGGALSSLRRAVFTAQEERGGPMVREMRVDSVKAIEPGARESLTNAASKGSTEADVLIMCALKEEFDAVVGLLPEVPLEEQSRGMRRARFTIGQAEVHLVCAGDPGNALMAAATAQLIEMLRPSLALLVGIAGGLPDAKAEFRLGDVVVPPQIIGYELAKVTPGHINIRLRTADVSSSAIGHARAVAEAGSWWGEIGTTNPPNVQFGAMLSGGNVVADALYRDELGALWPDSIAVEMEAVGFVVAAFTAESAPQILITKGVCDWANPGKNDEHHVYAARNAAAFALRLVQEMAGAVKRREPLRRREPRRDGQLKNLFEFSLGDSTEMIINALDVPLPIVQRWTSNQSGRLWEWAIQNQKFDRLPDTLEAYGRSELACLFYTDDDLSTVLADFFPQSPGKA